MDTTKTTKQDPNDYHFFETDKEHPNFKGYPDTRAPNLCSCCRLSLTEGKHLVGG